MGRETLLTVLLLLLGGLAVQPFALMPRRQCPGEAPQIAERRAWLQLWLPIVPALLVAAWLCGWALQESDPVHDRADPGMLVAACLPFALIALRAALRAAWAILRQPAELPICSTGLWRPHILFSPFLARALDEGQIRAAWEHEQAHVRHRDPLRIWLAQMATDLQWPWPWARERLDTWLEILECARDDEARSRGASGIDLAAAVVTTARLASSPLGPQAPRWLSPVDAPLLGDARSLQTRVARLLAPLPDSDGAHGWLRHGDTAVAALLAAMAGIAAASGAAYGEWIVHLLLEWTWAI
ncbi:MAG: hypothetical protein M0Z73_06090 [Betaproteobacteria bacterium]|nr:hypothetical protein [Betaproteobacteria bacterium]